ncbi:MAG: PBSX family phage terminase large subunit, partial [Clostridia bacterium]|nr:PBSX family phage terminase large subunit [Clostridia bacterium]
SGKKQKKLLTDEEYYERLVAICDGYDIKCVVIDPSAASFIATIRRHGRFSVRKADNNVLNGIRVTGTLLQSNKLLIHKSCTDAIREFGNYSWDEDSQEDKVIKEFDHAMDDIRYFCATVAKNRLL